MTDDDRRLTGDIAHQGWRIGIGFAGGAAGSPNFYAAYTGDVFGRPERGVLAMMARAHPGAAGQTGSAASQVVVHEFAEGYFSAPPTLGPKRAASRALAAINDWLAAQLRHSVDDRLAPVSLSALLFQGQRLAVLQIGCCRLFRVRRDAVTPLLQEQPPEPRPAAPGALRHRAVGQDPELSTDFIEEQAEDGDRYVLLSGLGAAQLHAVQALLAGGGGSESLARQLHELLARDRTVGDAAAAMVLDVIERPPPAGDDLAALPLRPAPRAGDAWDGFRIGKTLYQGRYTVVKAAYDEVENREVVLKIPLPAMLRDEVFTAGFRREAWIGATVRGAHVARYLELPAERRRSLYLAMPLYKGETLEARLLRAPPIALPEGIGIALELCEAIQELAAIQVIHRDIKPDNVMLLEQGALRLLDLGLAYLPGIDAQDAVKPGGTLRYMAPELIKGDPAGPRSEVYALAVTIYRMFTAGAYPFGQREAVPLARLRRDLPGWLGGILQRALAPEPRDRFPDAGALAAALQQGLIAGEADPVTANWRSGAARLRAWQVAALLCGAGFLYMLLRAFE